MASLRPHLIALLAPAATLAADKITYDDQVFPLFQQSCLNCHNPDKTKGGLDLSSYSGAMKGGSGGKIAEPGDLSSKLIVVCLQTGTPKMPPEGDKLGPNQIAILKGWIEGGLLENKNSSAKKPSKPKFETALKSDPAAKPDGPPPMPEHLRLEPYVATSRASAVHAMAASPWAPLIAITGQRQVMLHDALSMELVGLLPFPEGDPVSLAFTPDGRYLIVGGGVPGKSGTTVTFDVRNGERTLTVAKEFDSILAADIRPGFDVVASGGPSRLLKLWNTQTGSAIASIKKHTDWITALDISPDGILLASGDRNGGVWVWEAQSGNEFHTLRAHQAAITSTVFRSDSNLLATASEDGTVRLWEMNGGSEVRKIDAHPGGVTAMTLGRNGSILTTGRDGKLRLWKPDFSLEKELAQNLPALTTAVALAADDSRAFVADAAGTVRGYDLKTGQPAGEFSSAPPKIEARLAALDQQIQAQPAALAAFEVKAAEAGTRLEETRKALAAADEAAKQARQAHEAAGKTEADQRHRLNELRQQLAARRAELEKQAADLATTNTDLATRTQALAALPEDQRRPAELVAVETRRAELDAAVARLRSELGGFENQEKQLSAGLDEAVKATAAAADRIKASEQPITALRQEVATAEKALADRQGELSSAKAAPIALAASKKRWQAAAINTRALDASEQARKLQDEGDERISSFRTAAKSLETRMKELQDKRRELDELSSQLAIKRQQGINHEQLVEAEATLNSLRTSLEALTTQQAAAETELAGLRDSIDTAFPVLDSTEKEAGRLKREYLEALK